MYMCMCAINAYLASSSGAPTGGVLKTTMLVHSHRICTWKVGINGTAGIDVASAGILFSKAASFISEFKILVSNELSYVLIPEMMEV